MKREIESLVNNLNTALYSGVTFVTVGRKLDGTTTVRSLSFKLELDSLSRGACGRGLTTLLEENYQRLKQEREFKELNSAISAVKLPSCPSYIVWSKDGNSVVTYDLRDVWRNIGTNLTGSNFEKYSDKNKRNGAWRATMDLCAKGVTFGELSEKERKAATEREAVKAAKSAAAKSAAK